MTERTIVVKPPLKWRELSIPLAELRKLPPPMWLQVRNMLTRDGFELLKPKPTGEPRLKGLHEIRADSTTLLYRQAIRP